jgi:predicted HTH domain antitoxin
MPLSSININIPSEILIETGLSEKAASAHMLKLFAMDLYKRNQISSGKAAEMLDIHKYDFIRLLDEAGISYFDYSEIELEEEMRTVRSWNSPNE